MIWRKKLFSQAWRQSNVELVKPKSPWSFRQFPATKRSSKCQKCRSKEMHVGPFSFPWKLVRWSVLDDLNRTWFTFVAREKVNQVFSQTGSLSLSPKRTCSVHNLKLKIRRFDFLSFSGSHWFSGFPKEKSFNLAWMRSIGWQQWSSKRSPVVGHWGSRSTEKIFFIVESFVQQRCQMCQIQFLPIFLIVQVKVALYTVHFPRIMQWAVRVYISKVKSQNMSPSLKSGSS